MPRPIDFFIVGAPKAGTDALRDWLNESRETWVYGPVEPNYFCDDISSMHKDKNAWTKKVVRQARAKRLVGEKSTWYLGSQAAISEIATRFPKARIVILTREHVSLFLSLHAELVKLGVEPELDPMIAWRKTSADPRRIDFANNFLPNYIVSCQIGQQIERWIERFGHERVLIARIQDLETESGRRRVAEFLGLHQFPDTPAQIANKRLSTANLGVETSAAATGTARSLLRRAKSVARSLVRGVAIGSARPASPRTRQVALALTDHDFRDELTEFFAADAGLSAELERSNREHHRKNG